MRWERGRAEGPERRALRERRVPRAVRPRVADRGLDRPPEHHPDLRRGRGRRAALHRDALRRGRRPEDADPRGGAALAATGGGSHLAGRARRSTRRTSARARPPRHQAREHPDRAAAATASVDHAYLADFGLMKHLVSRSGADRHRPVPRHGRLRRARAGRGTRDRRTAPTSTRSDACSTSASPAPCRTTRDAMSRCCSRTSRTPVPRVTRPAARLPPGDRRDRRAGDGKASRATATPSAGDLSRELLEARGRVPLLAASGRRA